MGFVRSVPVSSKGHDRVWTRGGGGKSYHKWVGPKPFLGGALCYVFPSPEFSPPTPLFFSGLPLTRKLK